MKQRYRRLEVGESLRVGDFYTSKSNPQPPESTSGMIQVTSEQNWMFGKVYREDIGCYYYRLESVKPQRLIRKYRLVKDNEPVRMFDWFKTRSCYAIDKAWPSPDTQYNGGWVQIEPGYMDHLLDGSPVNKEEFTFARFVDCIPITES